MYIFCRYFYVLPSISKIVENHAIVRTALNCVRVHQLCGRAVALCYQNKILLYIPSTLPSIFLIAQNLERSSMEIIIVITRRKAFVRFRVARHRLSSVGCCCDPVGRSRNEPTNGRRKKQSKTREWKKPKHCPGTFILSLVFFSRNPPLCCTQPPEDGFIPRQKISLVKGRLLINVSSPKVIQRSFSSLPVQWKLINAQARKRPIFQFSTRVYFLLPLSIS